MEAIINQERVRARVSEYIANRGYVKERTFGPGRPGLGGLCRSAPFDLNIQNTFWISMETLGHLKEIFEPVKEIYQKGRDLYAKTSVLTPRYKEISEINDSHERAMQEDYENNPGFLRVRRLGHRLIRFIGDPLVIPLPPKVSDEESRQSLGKLYSMLQEDENGTLPTSLPEDSSDLEVVLHGIKRDLFKIKNHTSIVCLNQLQKDGLKLDEEVSAELGKVPKEYLKDPHVWNEMVSNQFKLRNGMYLFGDGLF